ncbi:AIPR family protein [Staphylococcus saprophyticus]|uniref:AIPR family protein n=1 Tax=Staphylococcus saprophyticus TaxID=29385 RepID=UPI001886E7D5|nr:AIPR family protein [Staphylococcus saprophyticus]MBF2753491.1 AIPR family protein [Staphylococcus saprophyticus]
MANINDFKNVKKRAKNYAKYLDISDETYDKFSEKFGFYLLILECITTVKDIDELTDMIIDTEFRSEVFQEKNNDLGIDAVNINEEDHIIQLFNFKFRSSFKRNKGQNLSDMVDASKFLLPIDNENTNNISPITKVKLDNIIKRLNSEEIWRLELYMVSNENEPLKTNDPVVEQFMESYGMEVKTITLNDIISYISELPEDLTAKFVLDRDSVMTYEMNQLSTSKSYLIKIPLAELIRITCSNEEIRNNRLNNYNKLQNQELELSLLFDNVRGYLGNTKYNSNIIKTIEQCPNRFFMYNNGLTITAKNIKADYINGKKKFECEINGFQIVNGGQTLRSIYEFCNKEFDEEKLATAEILIKIFQTEKNKELTNDIAEYTNSQNSISPMDLKSVNNFQIQLGSFLKSHQILYVRKSGDVGESDINYNNRISMEKVAQILYTYMGKPDRATNQKKALFEKYYDEIFDEDSLDFELVLNLINQYFSIEDEYKKSDINGFHQKYLYVLFITNKIMRDKTKVPASNSESDNIKKAITLLEQYVNQYKNDEDISSARKLIQKGFKDFISQKLSK